MDYVLPMKPPSPSVEPFDSTDYIFERKWDGQRMQAYCENGTVLDGEMVVLKDGDSVFNAIQQRNTDDPLKVRLRAANIPATYMVFDVLRVGGTNVLDKQLFERKIMLEDVPQKLENFRLIHWSTSKKAFMDYTHRFPEISSFEHSMFLPEKGIQFFQQAEKAVWEGLIAKLLTSTYVPAVNDRRCDWWLKLKCWAFGDFVVGGYVKGNGKREGWLGSLLLWEPLETGGFKYAGDCGSGWDDFALAEMTPVLDRCAIPDCHFQDVPTTKKGDVVVWTHPIVWVKIKYQKSERKGMLREGKLRFPIFPWADRNKFDGPIVWVKDLPTIQIKTK